MKQRRVIRLIQAAAIVVVTGLAGASRSETKSETKSETRVEKIVVVTTKKTGLDQLPASIVKDLFLARTTEYRGVTLIPLTPDTKAEIYKAFVGGTLGLSPSDEAAYWEQAKRERRARPLSISNSKLLQRFLLSRPGVVTFMYESEFATLAAFLIKLSEV